MNDIEQKSSKKALNDTLASIVSSFDDVNFNQSDVDELQEWLLCKEDFFHFLRKYIKLDLPGYENEFIYHNGQELVVRSLMEDHYIYCLKSRQIGITTVIRAYCAWLTIFHNNYSIGIISKSGPDASAFIRKTITVIDELPKFLKPEFAKKTEQQYILKNGSMAMSAAVSASQPENTLRSNPIVFLVIDEGAFIHKINEALTGLLPTTVTVQQAAKRANIPYGILVISTPNKTKGTGKWFFKGYQQAVSNNGVNGNMSDGSYKAIKLHWKDLNGPFDEEWYQAQCKVQNFKADNIAQEVDCVFLPSTKNGIISREQVIEVNKYQRQPDYIIEAKGGDIYVFDNDLPGKTKQEDDISIKESDNKEEKKPRRFLIGVDTATSSGVNAYSSIQAIDFDTCEQVIEYMGKLSIYDYPEVLKRVCKELGDNIFIIIERNTIGETIVESIRRDPTLEPKMFYTVEKNDKGTITKRFPGFQTSGKTKPLLMEAVHEFFKEFLHTIHGERTILQLTTVEIKDGKLIGLPNDLIMCYAFIAYIRRNNLASFSNVSSDSKTQFGSALEGFSQNDIINYLYDNDINVQRQIANKKGKYINPLEYLNS